MAGEDKRGSNFISSVGMTRPLSYGEAQCLAMQAKNQREAGDMTPGEVEERSLRALTVDADLKRPRIIKDPPYRGAR